MQRAPAAPARTAAAGRPAPRPAHGPGGSAWTCEALDRVGQDRGGRAVDAVRPDEGADERARPLLVAAVEQRRPKLSTCSVRSAATRSRPPLASTRYRKCRVPSCELRYSSSSTVKNGPPDDPGLDQRAGVDPDHGRAVVERVEEVGLGLVVDAGGRIARPDTRPRCPRRSRSTSCHWAAFCGWGGSAPRPTPAARRPARSAAQPAPHERHLVRGDPLRGAGVEHERLVGAAGRSARRTPRGWWSGWRTNHSSKICAPVATTCPGGMPCSSTASRRWCSFQTVTRSGRIWISPLLVRLSQLATQTPVGMPRARALLS